MFWYNKSMFSHPAQPGDLHGDLHVALHAAVLAAFSRDELRRLLKVHFDTELEQITGDKGLDAQVFDLLLWLERQGHLASFVTCACTANPTNAQLGTVRAALHARGVAAIPPDLPSLLGIDWVAIAGGALRMGSDPNLDDWALPAETPPHVVDVPPYRMARCPITNDQYSLFVVATGHAPPPHWPEGSVPQGKSNHPVVNVSWYDALAFCAWAGVRLPTEPQWELAARGADGRLWPWGNEKPTALRCNFALRVGGTTPADMFGDGASPYGVLDLAGNVWEWSSSLYLPYPYAGRDDPQASGLRVVRGGCYDSPARHVRCASRVGINPRYGYDDVGLRVVQYNRETISSRRKKSHA
jgi:formylglycine-generating enzyme required for sulfatase activity